MTENVYDIPISEVAKILEKSDRQVRRYVKERRLQAKPVRIDGHIKLMFNKTEVASFREQFASEGIPESVAEIETAAEAVDIDTTITPDTEPQEVESIGVEESAAVRYAIDALKEQISELKTENKDLHYQLEQRSGQVGFLQGKIEMLQEEVKALAPAPKPVQEAPAKKSWWPFGRRN